MSNVSFIEKLLDGVDVEWKALGEAVTTITAPSKVKKEVYRATGKTPIIDQGKGFIAGYTDENIAPVKSDEYIVFGDHSEHIKYVYFSFVQGADGLKILKSTLNNTKYIYYAFQTFYLKELSYKRHWSTAKETLIPIPPLSIQTEIVRILDTFTTHTAELTAELTARKKQYNYYRDQLLTFEYGDVEWKALGEVVRIKRGKRLVKSQLETSGNYAVYQNSMTPLGYYHDGNVKSDTTFIISAGAAGKIGYSNYDFWAADDVYFFLTPDNIESKFLYYFLLTQQNKISSQVRWASIPRLSKKVVERLQISIPPLAEQTRIVSILDKFDALTNSISEGLPREIKLRQQQYEYYRDLLLSFPKSETTA
ncbi:type I restriction enzyme, S subunit [Bathymodiolus platifrons methanotrophic gill symbiont]|uniref:restriction endonuclease subunit S n=1 Tax=Bathymodiolus platifrons methanotrophic gill symbiont TaxID=113268 RepID=UPI001B7190AC|nr:restriction endonuclease subunit S [Bathymodiolus platifrons methanotrophic gill symbiont]GFO75743.1 type I restriction enzyme, S subunit [Bathymodiolus platifrons methanotrophic gill symbiont]